jgi:4-amino-4-deoxy-L-arabinose transferase-like glycosyltransferase
MDEVIQKLKKDKIFVGLFLLVIFVGIFLRVYNFHDWLRFSGDQSRDAKIVSDMISGKGTFPLLGPKAGTTKFLLGPAYYYFSYISAKIFGNYPDKMAYPSLFSAILVLPLLFIFLKEYFDKKIALALTALASVSYVLILASRFSSNPNLTPFFILLFLYAFLKILNNPKGKNYYWSALVGVAMGIGVQLHTTVFVVLPIVALVVLGYLLVQRRPNVWKYFFIILVFSLLLNTTQFISEFNSGWQNSQQFFKGFSNDSARGESKINNVLYISACQIHANSLMLSSISPFGADNTRSTQCSKIFVFPSDKSVSENKYLIYMPLSILFSVAGYVFLILKLKNESDIRKRNFLGLVLLYNVVALVVFIPIAGMMYSGYLLILFVVPFVMLGVMLEMLIEKYGLPGKRAAILALALLVFLSLRSDYAEAARLYSGLENNTSNSTLGEIERMSNYVLFTSDKNSKVYISGKGKLALRFFKPLSYFIIENGGSPIMLKSSLKSIDPLGSPQGGNVQAGIPIYFVQSNKKGEKSSAQAIMGHSIVGSKKFSQQTIFKLNN